MNYPTLPTTRRLHLTLAVQAFAAIFLMLGVLGLMLHFFGILYR